MEVAKTASPVSKMTADDAWAELESHHATDLFNPRQASILRKYSLTDAESEDLMNRIMVATFGTNPPGMRQNVIDFFAITMQAPPAIVERMAALLRGKIP